MRIRNEDYDDVFLSVNFKRLIWEAGHNNTSFAEKAGISEAAIRNLLNVKNPFNPKTKTLIRISNALNLPVEEIIKKEDD